MTVTAINRPRAAAQTATLRFEFISAQYDFAKRLHSYIKLAKRQGVKVTGTYRYSRWNDTLEALNLAFEGPADTIQALESAISGEQSDAEERDRRRMERRAQRYAR